VALLDAMDCHRSSCLAGDVNCEDSAADGLQFVPAVVAAGSPPVPQREDAAVQGRGQCRNDRGRDQRRDGPGRPWCGRQRFDGGCCVH